MTRDEGFLEVLMDRPDDLNHRLVYADWLDDQGDPRAEFLRLTATLAGLPETDARRASLEARTEELRASLPWDWLIRVDRSCAEEAVREVVFRDSMGEGPFFRPVYLAVEGGTMPSSRLLARLRKYASNIQPVSEESQGGAGYPFVSIDGLVWASGRKCKVECGWSAGPLAGMGQSLTVEWKEGVWSITERVGTWIS